MPAPPRRRMLPGWAIFAIGVVAVVGVLSMTSYLTGQPALTSSLDDAEHGARSGCRSCSVVSAASGPNAPA